MNPLLRIRPTGESRLPSGDPAGRGIPLDPDISGQSTFNKPENDKRDSDRSTDTSIFRMDNADGLLKDQSIPDTNEENANKHDGIGWSGGGEQDASPKTKYPYRDGRPNHHNASEVVVGRYLLDISPERVLTAARIDQIDKDLSTRTIDRARSCKVSLKRADTGNLRWIFSVNCGNGDKLVKLKAGRQGKTVRLTKMDLKFSCSCPSWRWQGPEYHAKQEGYLDGKPRGTASAPDSVDPGRQNRVCKHVAAVLTHVRSWEVPAR